VVDAVSETLVVGLSLVSSHDEHLEKGKLVAKAVVQVLEGLADLARSSYSVIWADRATSLGTAASQVFKVDSWGALALRGASASTSAATGRSTSTDGVLVLPQVVLHVLGHHLVKHGRRDVLERLAEGSPHLVLDLSLEEVVKAFTLSIKSL
jgi:hypothetical protein